eukprot:5284191-Amphidinium_carterae.1
MPARFAEVVVDAVVEAADQRNRQFDITSLQFANGTLAAQRSSFATCPHQVFDSGLLCSITCTQFQHLVHAHYILRNSLLTPQVLDASEGDVSLDSTVQTRSASRSVFRSFGVGWKPTQVNARQRKRDVVRTDYECLHTFN